MKTEQESHMKLLTIMYHRTSGPRERGSPTQLEVRAFLLFCCLVCAKEKHSLINPNPQLPRAYRECFLSLSLQIEKKMGGLFFLSVRKASIFKNPHWNSSWASYATLRNRKTLLYYIVKFLMKQTRF